MFKKLCLSICAVALIMSTLPAAQAFQFWDWSKPIQVRPWHLVGLSVEPDRKTVRCDWAYIIINLERNEVLESYYVTNYGTIWTVCPKPDAR